MLAGRAIALIPVVRRAPTLAQWRRSHAADSVVWETVSDEGEFDDNGCATSSGPLLLANGKRGRRVAHFVVPRQRPDEPLPASNPELRYQCLLGAVELFGPTDDSPTVQSAYRADSLHLDGVLPRAHYAGQPWQWIPGGRYVTFTWVADSIGVGIRTVDFDDSETPFPKGHLTWYAVVSSPLGRTGLESALLTFDVDARHAAPIVHPALFDTLLALAGVSRSDAERLLALVNGKIDSPHDTIESSTRDGGFIAAVTDLIAPDSMRSLDHQIGRFLAADWLIDSSEWALVPWRRDDATRLRSDLAGAFGATFAYDHFDGWLYNHVLLSRALALGGDGPAASRAFLTALDRKFMMSGDCGGTNNVDSVRIHGLAYLAAHRASPVRGDVEIRVAEAFGDEVVIAAGGGYDGMGDSLYIPVRESAMAESVTHFRRAFALVGATVRARADWIMAWRLNAGLPPLGTRLYCFND